MARRLDPLAARERAIKAGMIPSTAYPGSNRLRWPGICSKCGRPVSPSLSNAERQGPCKACGRERQKEAARLPSSVVIQNMEAKGVVVVGDYVNNREPIRCVCTTCGAVVFPTYSNAMRDGAGLCSEQCKRDKIGASNRLEAQAAAAVALANNLIPLAPYVRSGEPWKVQCGICGHVSNSTTYGTIARLGHVCVRCGRARTAKARRLPEEEAVSSMLAAALQPDTPYPGNTGTNWPCTCMICQTVIRPGPRLGDIRSGQGGCPECSDTSFKPDLPGHVYLVANPRIGFLKWGRANDLENRLSEHARQGFTELAGEWRLSKGVDATYVEKAAGLAIRAAGAPTTVAKSLMPYKGYTETASLDEISAKAVRLIIQRLVETRPWEEAQARHRDLL